MRSSPTSGLSTNTVSEKPRSAATSWRRRSGTSRPWRNTPNGLPPIPPSPTKTLSTCSVAMRTPFLILSSMVDSYKYKARFRTTLLTNRSIAGCMSHRASVEWHLYVLSWRGGRRDQGKWVWDDSYFGRALRRSWGCCGLGVAPLLSEPTQTDSPIVVQGIQRLNELATVKWTQQVIVEEEGNEEIWRRYLPELLSGERVLLIAVGDVQGGVNLDELSEVAEQVEEHRETIDLPE